MASSCLLPQYKAMCSDDVTFISCFEGARMVASSLRISRASFPLPPVTRILLGMSQPIKVHCFDTPAFFIVRVALVRQPIFGAHDDRAGKESRLNLFTHLLTPTLETRIRRRF